MKKLQSIGITELVSLPDMDIQNVQAKIDTGADGSAIWASNISEHDKQLSFTLFGKTSPFYSGKLITTRDYKVVSVKNSFGQVELRYRVKLRLSIGGRAIQTTVNLANRQHNTYPILIGRRTLQGRFLVNIPANSAKKEHQVLMIFNRHIPSVDKFAKSLENYSNKLKVTSITYEDLCFTISETGNRITLIDSGRDVADFDLIYFKTSTHFKGIAATVANYLQKRNVPFIDQALQHFPGSSKLYQYVILTDNDIPVPRSIFMLPAHLEQSYDLLKQDLGLPFILKDIQGNKGENNFLINSRKTFKEACQEAAKQEALCIAQIFIDNDQDYRILVFGRKIALVIKRSRTTKSTHLNNTSLGAEANLVNPSDIPESVRSTSLAAAKLLGRQVAGVDFVQDKSSGLWYCLEVNDGPQLASGTFTAEKHAAFAEYLERKLSK